MTMLLEGFERFSGQDFTWPGYKDALGWDIRTSANPSVGKVQAGAGFANGRGVGLDFERTSSPSPSLPIGWIGLQSGLRAGVTTHVVGFKMRVLNNPVNDAVFAMGNSVAYPSSSANTYLSINPNGINIFLLAGSLASFSHPGPASGNWFSVELVTDYVARTMALWVDGVRLGVSSRSSAIPYLTWIYFTAQNTTHYQVDDFYTWDNRYEEIAHSPLGDWKIDLTTPAASPVAQFTPTPDDRQNWEVVGDIPTNDATFVSSQQIGQHDIHTLAALSGVLSPNDAILAVQAQTIVQSDLGPADVTSAVGLGNDFVTQTTALSAGESGSSIVTTRVNPSTGNPWTPADLDALRSGYVYGTTWPTL